MSETLAQKPTIAQNSKPLCKGQRVRKILSKCQACCGEGGQVGDSDPHNDIMAVISPRADITLISLLNYETRRRQFLKVSSQDINILLNPFSGRLEG